MAEERNVCWLNVEDETYWKTEEEVITVLKFLNL
jgi:hypothetical protein